MKRITLLLTLFCLLVYGAQAQSKSSQIDKALTIYADVLRQLDMSYADTLNYAELTENSVNYMLRKLDPYTTYIPEEEADELRRMTTGKYAGIGAVISQRRGEKDVYIADPYEGKPAAKADIRAGDKILAIDGKSIEGLSSTEVSKRLRGAPGSTITLKVQRYGEAKPIERTFLREEIKMDPVDYATLIDGTVAYISFTDFTENSARIFTDTLDNLVARGATSLIIDLRNNGGGLIDEAVKIVANFVEKGTEVVSTKGRISYAKRTYRTPYTPKYPNMPVVVIVNGQTASSAEIVAGALQDLDRATIIGERTFGKGLVQNIRPISYNGNLKLTTAKYYIPSGRCIQAVKYNHDGSAERVPDSLTHEFKTKEGRIVRDGGGIEPDIVISDSTKVNICYSLYMQNMFFDFATRYRATHPTLSPASEYTVSDEELNEFIAFLHEKKFDYKTETSKYFADVLKMAHNEDIDSTTLAKLEAIQAELNPSFETAIWQQKDDVKQLLGNEIVRRYYFQRGSLIFGLRTDETLQRALQILDK